MTILFTPAFISASLLGFLSGSDTIAIVVILVIFALIGYAIYRVIGAISSGAGNNNQQTQLLTEILTELKKLNERSKV